MKKNNVDIKSSIRKKIEQSQENLIHLNDTKLMMNTREYKRNGNTEVVANVNSLSRDERRTGVISKKTPTDNTILINSQSDVNNKVLVPPEPSLSESQLRNERRGTSTSFTPQSQNLSRDDRRTISNEKPYEIAPTSGYKRKVFVDYDVVICIPSFNRYRKVKRLISQFHTQPTKYRFKIILLNDGSSDKSYDNLAKEFPNIIYLKNEKPNGKTLHWFCYNQMWNYLKNIECYTVLQMDDDFILSNHFLNTILDLYFEKKEENKGIVAISPHLWSFKKKSNFESWWNRKDFIDGIGLLDIELIEKLEYELKPVNAIEVSKPGVPVRAWTQISEGVKKIRGIVYRTSNSLVYHDGNNDSKLHGDVRINGKNGVYTQKYIEKL